MDNKRRRRGGEDNGGGDGDDAVVTFPNKKAKKRQQVKADDHDHEEDEHVEEEREALVSGLKHVLVENRTVQDWTDTEWSFLTEQDTLDYLCSHFPEWLKYLLDHPFTQNPRGAASLRMHPTFFAQAESLIEDCVESARSSAARGAKGGKKWQNANCVNVLISLLSVVNVVVKEGVDVTTRVSMAAAAAPWSEAFHHFLEQTVQLMANAYDDTLKDVWLSSTHLPNKLAPLVQSLILAGTRLLSTMVGRAGGMDADADADAEKEKRRVLYVNALFDMHKYFMAQWADLRKEAKKERAVGSMAGTRGDGSGARTTKLRIISTFTSLVAACLEEEEHPLASSHLLILKSIITTMCCDHYLLQGLLDEYENDSAENSVLLRRLFDHMYSKTKNNGRVPLLGIGRTSSISELRAEFTVKILLQMLHCDDILNGFKNEKKEEGRGSDDEEEGGESKLEEEIIDENYYHGGIVPLFCRKAKGEAAISSQPWITPRALPICKLLIEDTWKTASDVLDIRGSIWALGFQTGAWIIVGHIGGLPPNALNRLNVIHEKEEEALSLSLSSDTGDGGAGAGTKQYRLKVPYPYRALYAKYLQNSEETSPSIELSFATLCMNKMLLDRAQFCAIFGADAAFQERREGEEEIYIVYPTPGRKTDYLGNEQVLNQVKAIKGAVGVFYADMAQPITRNQRPKTTCDRECIGNCGRGNDCCGKLSVQQMCVPDFYDYAQEETDLRKTTKYMAEDKESKERMTSPTTTFGGCGSADDGETDAAAAQDKQKRGEGEGEGKERALECCFETSALAQPLHPLVALSLRTGIETLPFHGHPVAGAKKQMPYRNDTLHNNPCMGFVSLGDMREVLNKMFS